jgi:signal transduction histidine kinase/CHASE3 domain sensor protein
MSFLANIGLRSKLLGAFGVVVFVLVILASTAYRTTTMNQEATDRVAHTLQVMSLANEALANVLDLETSYRGFLLAGDESLLESYGTANQQLDAQLAELRRLTEDNPEQVARWDEIGAQVLDWRMTAARQGIMLRREVTAGTASIDDVVDFVVAGEGRRRISSIRTVFQEALARESALLAERQDEATNRRLVLEIVLIVGTVVGVGLALLLALALSADLTGPVRRLAVTAREIASGRLDRRIGLQREDEVGVAAQAFDRMAERLAASIAESEAILDTAVEGIIGLDRAGRVTFANQAAAAMLGQPSEALEGRAVTPWLVVADGAGATSDGAPSMSANGVSAGGTNGTAAGSDDPAPANRLAPTPAPILSVLERGTVEHGEGEIDSLARDARMPIEYAVAPLRSGEEVVGAVLTFRDVTERLAAQHELEDSNRELARSNADLEQFAYVASHDLQEPLRAVVSYLQLLERRYAENLDERAVRYIGHAVEGGRRMQTLINDLLAYSRVGRREIAPEPVDVESVLDRTLTSLRVALEESEAVVTHDPLPTIVADQGQLAQLLQNLVGNAIKFRGEEPPRVHISAERQEEDRAWLFSVSDNGIGIAPEYRERVFLLFQRLHGREEYSGTGIGLAICKKIVERHGGALWVDSTPGGGSTFHFTIPDAGGESP